MSKKMLVALLFVLMASLLLTTAVAMAREVLIRVEVINRSEESVSISLIGETAYYFLAVPAGETRWFTVERDVYQRTTFACGDSNSGSVDLTTHKRLIFTRCYGDAPNWGEPGMEKIHIDDSPDGKNWFYK
jgi:hypothetical protein